MRAGAVGLISLAMLAGCSSESASGSGAGAAGDEKIPCALAGAEKFADECAVQRAPQDGALFLVVRHPDGAFRRFEVLKDGRGLALADGAEQAEAKLDGGILEVMVNEDRYRFPATRTSDATAN